MVCSKCGVAGHNVRTCDQNRAELVQQELEKDAEDFMKEDNPELYGSMIGINIYYNVPPQEKNSIFIYDENVECKHLVHPNKLSTNVPDFSNKLNEMIGQQHIYAFVTKYTCEKSGTGSTTRGTKKDRADNEERLNEIRDKRIIQIINIANTDKIFIEGTLKSGNAKRVKTLTEKDWKQHNNIKKRILSQYQDEQVILSPHSNTGNPIERYRKFSIFSKYNIEHSEMKKSKQRKYCERDIERYLDTIPPQKELTSHMKQILHDTTKHLESDNCYRTTNVNGSSSWAKNGCLGALSNTNTIKFTYSSELVIFKSSDKTNARKLTGNELLRFQGMDTTSDMFMGLSDSRKKKIASHSPSYFILNELLKC